MTVYNIQGAYHPEWSKEQREAYDGARGMAMKEHQYRVEHEEDGSETAECSCGWDGESRHVGDHIEYDAQTAGIAAAARAGEQ